MDVPDRAVYTFASNSCFCIAGPCSSYTFVTLVWSHRKWAFSMAAPCYPCGISTSSCVFSIVILSLLPQGFLAILTTSQGSLLPSSLRKRCQHTLFFPLMILFIFPFAFFHFSHPCGVCILAWIPWPPLALWRTSFSCFLRSGSQHVFDFPLILRFLGNFSVRYSSWSYGAASGRLCYHCYCSVSSSLPIDSKYVCSLLVSVVILLELGGSGFGRSRV